MNEERKIHTPYDYCLQAIEMLCDIEGEADGMPDSVACEILKAAQLMWIVDKLNEIDEKLDECAAHLCGLSVDGIKAYIYGD